MFGMQGTVFCFLEKEPKPLVFTHNSLHTKVVTVPVQPCAAAQGPAFSKQLTWVQCQVLCKEIAELNILFTSTLLQCFSGVIWLVSLLVVTACLLQHCKELLPLQSTNNPFCSSLPRGQCFTAQCRNDRLLFK